LARSEVKTVIKRGQVAFNRMEKVIFGVPAAEAVAQQVVSSDARRVYLMVSGSLNRNTDAINHIRQALGDRCVAVFDRVPAHTPRKAVIEAAELAREIDTDVIVTVGGSSVTDAAKMVRLCLANNIRVPDEIDAFRPASAANAAPVSPPKSPTVRQISVPTTLSAAEFSMTSAVTDERTRRKEIFRHPDGAPQTVILDPTITQHTPEGLFLSSGVRAVDHCVEAICSNETNEFADASALHGLALLARGLMSVKANPADIDARMKCQIGAWLSMVAVIAGVPMGASHGIGYILGSLFGVPHGQTSCIMLPAVMQWNKPVNAKRQALVATTIGQSDENASDLLDKLIRGLGMPRSLSAVDIRPEHFDTIAEQAMHTPWVPRNPRKIAGPAEVREILEIAA
jgi:maleylacetate reductase